MTNSQTLNPAHESFVIVQTDDDEINPDSLSQPKPYDTDFTFVGGAYPTLDSANTAALNLAAKKCNCEIPALTFPTSSTAFKHTTKSTASMLQFTHSSAGSNLSASGSLSSETTSPLLSPTARPQLIQQRSGDGRYSCCCMSFEEEGGEGRGIRFEVRKIEITPLGSRMGWNLSDDDA